MRDGISVDPPLCGGTSHGKHGSCAKRLGCDGEIVGKIVRKSRSTLLRITPFKNQSGSGMPIQNFIHMKKVRREGAQNWQSGRQAEKVNKSTFCDSKLPWFLCVANLKVRVGQAGTATPTIHYICRCVRALTSCFCALCVCCCAFLALVLTMAAVASTWCLRLRPVVPGGAHSHIPSGLTAASCEPSAVSRQPVETQQCSRIFLY